MHPVALLATIIVTLAATALRLAGAALKPSLLIGTAVAILGLASTLLILRPGSLPRPERRG